MDRDTANIRIEERVYEKIDDLAEELRLDVPYYPHVYWINKKTRFKDLNLSRRYLDDYRFARSGKNIFLSTTNVILIGSNHVNSISEESGHFLHFTNSSSYTYKRLFEDYFSFEVISEILGFFCSKLISSSRSPYLKYNFEEMPDDPEDISEFLRDVFGTISNLEIDPAADDLIHYEGYKLGDRLFLDYIDGRVSLRKIKHLLQHDFKKRGEAFKEFINLRDRLN